MPIKHTFVFECFSRNVRDWNDFTLDFSFSEDVADLQVSASLAADEDPGYSGCESCFALSSNLDVSSDGEHETVVDQLRAAGDEKGAAAAAYKEWARGNEPAVVALAKFHRMGVRGLDLGLRGVIEKLQLVLKRKEITEDLHSDAPRGARHARALR